MRCSTGQIATLVKRLDAQESNTDAAPVCDDDQRVLLSVPRTRVQAPFPAKGVEGSRGQVFGHQTAHAP